MQCRSNRSLLCASIWQCRVQGGGMAAKMWSTPRVKSQRARESESQELWNRQWPGGMPEEGCWYTLPVWVRLNVAVMRLMGEDNSPYAKEGWQRLRSGLEIDIWKEGHQCFHRSPPEGWMEYKEGRREEGILELEAGWDKIRQFGPWNLLAQLEDLKRFVSDNLTFKS